MRKFVISMAIMLLNSQALAIDLQEALVNAYNNNDDLKINRRDFLNTIEDFPQALAEFMPSVTASFDSTKTRSKSKSQFRNGAPFTKIKSIDKAIMLEQPIFNGGASIAALKAAQSGFRAARGRYYANEQDLILRAIETYLTYYESKEKYDISETSVKVNQKQLEAEQEKLNVGEATETVLASAKFLLAQAETKKLSAYANLQTAKADFVKTFGIEPVNITFPEVPNDLPKSFEELQQKSLAANQSLESAKHVTTASKAGEMVAKSSLLPQISFKVQARKSYYDPKSQNSTNFQNGGSISSAISVRVSIIPKGGAVYSGIRKAKILTRSSAIKQEAKVKDVIAGCISSWEGFNAAKSSIESSTQGIEAAKRAYEGMVQEELVGSKALLDVLNMEEKLNNAKFSKVEANKQYIFAAYQMKSLLGQLTAKSLKLNVNYFVPENEFKKVKMKVIGF